MRIDLAKIWIFERKWFISPQVVHVKKKIPLNLKSIRTPKLPLDEIFFFFSNTFFSVFGGVLSPYLELRINIIIFLIRFLQKDAYECANKNYILDL